MSTSLSLARKLLPSSGMYQDRPPRTRTSGIFQRLIILGGVLALELIAFSIWLDTNSISHSNGLTKLVADWSPAIVRGIIVSASAFAAFTYLKTRTASSPIVEATGGPAISGFALGSHTAVLALFAGLSSILFANRLTPTSADDIAALWLITGAALVASAGLTFIPAVIWAALLRKTGKLWLGAVGVGLGASFLTKLMVRPLWNSAASVTFGLVRLMLEPLVHQVVVNTTTRTLGTSRFCVNISSQCSGIEGAGLMLAFSVLWLGMFRKELRFPRALLLIPAGVVLIWALNAVRITLLILIGNAGAPGIALGGFHSQAGWIAFNAVAFGLSIAARRWSYVSVPRLTNVEDIHTDNPVAPYLAPFLAILAAAMIGSAVSSGLEWLYPLRLLVCAGILWHYRRRYGLVNWKFGPLAPCIGAGVFVIWLLLSPAGTPQQDTSALQLATWPAVFRLSWIVCRILAAVITVPIAEELAFRGFLLRRLIASDFESVGARRFTAISLVISSIAFGALHGSWWLAGSIAGVCYAAAVLRRGRLGDAIVAHATTNALICVWVLYFGKWYLW